MIEIHLRIVRVLSIDPEVDYGHGGRADSRPDCEEALAVVRLDVPARLAPRRAVSPRGGAREPLVGGSFSTLINFNDLLKNLWCVGVSGS